MVLVAAGIFLRQFIETRSEDTGFRRDGVLLAGYDLSGRGRNDAAIRAFAAALLDRLRAAPGIEAAAIASNVPLDIHGLPTRYFTLEGRARSDDGMDEALTTTVTPGYFDVMGLPLLAGRDFADLRDPAAAPQAIVNDEFVRRFGGGREILGRQIENGARTFTIAGIVRDSLYESFGDSLRIRRVSRVESGSPAAGSQAVHQQEQEAIIAEAVGGL